MLRFALLIVLLAVACTSCGKEPVPTIEELLPAGYREAKMPPELAGDSGQFEKGVVWQRCIDCDLDWTGLNSHVAGVVSGYGYSDTSAAWLKNTASQWKQSGMTDEQLNNYVKFYSKPSGSGGVVMMLNLAMVRDRGASVGTAGDFYIVVGYDNIDYYR